MSSSPKYPSIDEPVPNSPAQRIASPLGYLDATVPAAAQYAKTVAADAGSVGVVVEPAFATIPVLKPGTLIKHYELIRKLGAGGMGMVFLARDTRLGRRVAIKFLLEYSGSAAQRFLVEAQITAQCRHENIVVIYDVDELHGYPYMVLEFIPGRSLRDVMMSPDHLATPGSDIDGPRRARAGSAGLAVDLILPVLRALACAHEMGIVHRDLKPENILLSDAGQVKVLDFGIAKEVSVAWTSTNQDMQPIRIENAGLTEDGALVGTLPYMSPEQLLGEPIDARTDIWAVGIILFELLAGTHPLAPFSGAKLVEVAYFDKPMPNARERNPEAGPLADLIERCLKKRRDERIGSANELIRELEQLKAEKVELTPAEDESPFAGLAALQESDAGRFFGRDDDVAALINKLRHQELVAIAGPSGAGKSSFVRAGIIPALKRSGSGIEAFVIRPGRHPLAALADVLVFFATTSGDAALGETDPEALAETLRTQPGALGSILRARCRRRSSDHRILLVVDQLEELYTLGIEASERAAFCACLEGVADDASSPLRVIVTIRADFLDRVSEDRRFLSAMTRGLMFLPPMTMDGMRNVLQRPLEAARYRFEDQGLCDEILGDLAGMTSPLPLLQFTATKLWEARNREKRLLTREAYRALGGVSGALSTHADAVLSGMSLPERQLARAIFLRLVTPERTRAVVRWEELCALSEEPALAEQVVHHLADARLLSIEAGGEREGKTAELTHESLIERWAKLGQWLDENEKDAEFLVELRNAASQWEKNREAEGFLWRDEAASKAGQWLARKRAEGGADGTLGLGKRDRRYLEAAVRLAERSRRRRRQATAGIMAFLGLFGFVVSFLGLQARDQARRADENAADAQKNAVEANQRAAGARNASRMASAREHLSDPTLVLALVREMEPAGELPPRWRELALWAKHQEIASVVLHHQDGVTSAAFSPDGGRIVTTSWDKTVRVWNADGTGKPLLLEGHRNLVLSAAFSPDGRRIVTTSYDKTARVWNADGTGQPLLLEGHQDHVYSAAFSPDGRRIVTASSDKTAGVWNADGTGKPILLEGHQGSVTSAAFSPDGTRIVTASSDKTARVWNADGTGKPLRFEGHQGGVTSAAFSPDGRRIVTASSDKTARVWNADGTGESLRLEGHQVSVKSAAFSPDGRRIVTASWDKTARVWNSDGTGKPLLFEGHQNVVHSAAFSPDGRTIVTASSDKTARVWNADGAGKPLRLEGHQDVVHSAAFSPDSRRIVTASWDKTAGVWYADGTGQPLRLEGHQDVVHSAAFSPDGRRIVTASRDKTARVWNADGTGQPLRLEGHQDVVYSAAFSPDGMRIVTASGDKTVRVWSADGTGQPLLLEEHQDMVTSAAFSPDGARIVTGSFDKTARVWSADGTGKPVLLEGHGAAVVAGAVGGGAFSSDGAQIVTASDDQTLRLWNADGTGEPAILRIPELDAVSAAFSPDGTRIATASHSGIDPATGKVKYWATVWPRFERITGLDDSALWTATRYCPPIELRKELLGVSAELAAEQLASCQRRVAEANDHP